VTKILKELTAPDHPIWGIGRILAVGCLLYVNASKFDETEMAVIIGHIVAEIGAGAITRLARPKAKKGT